MTAAATKSSWVSRISILQPDSPPAGSGSLFLTFDDGPREDDISSRLLDVLARHEVRACFCYIGRNVERNPELVQRAFHEGHLLCNHTYSHSPGILLRGKTLRADFLRCEEVFAKALGVEGYRSSLFRPPFGVITPAVREVVASAGCSLAYLTFYVNDAAAGPRESRKILADMQARLLKSHGGAVVFHEMRYQEGRPGPDKSWLPALVEEFVCWARDRGFRFETYPGGMVPK